MPKFKAASKIKSAPKRAIPYEKTPSSGMETDINHQTPFVKQLAANDRPTRDAAVSSLETYLSGRRSLPPLELLKLHKGLFYCMWMSDRALTQQSLANALSSLVLAVPEENQIPFLRAFWQTMKREWTNIDVLRMEKFLLLTRRYLGATFRLLENRNWEAELVDQHLTLLQEVPLEVEDQRIPNGMRFHVIDIYVDELEKANALQVDQDGKNQVPLEILLGPLRQLASSSPTKPVRVKAKEALTDDRLPGNEKEEEVTEEVDPWVGFD